MQLERRYDALVVRGDVALLCLATTFLIVGQRVTYPDRSSSR